MTPAEALRAIADHLETHPTHGMVTVSLWQYPRGDDLDIILDGANPDDITIRGNGSTRVLQRDVGPVWLTTTVDASTVGRPVQAEAYVDLTPAELIATRVTA